MKTILKVVLICLLCLGFITGVVYLVKRLW
jgi:hypothetical protein